MLTTKEEASAAFQAIVEELKPIVKKIEASIPTTRDHYGSYMQVLSEAPDLSTKKLMAAALIKAGANEGGVAWALKLTK